MISEHEQKHRNKEFGDLLPHCRAEKENVTLCDMWAVRVPARGDTPWLKTISGDWEECSWNNIQAFKRHEGNNVKYRELCGYYC